MQRLRIFAILLAAGILPGGCIGMFAPKLPQPFRLDVPAAALDPLATPRPEPAETPAPAVAAATPEPKPQPERTNIVGAGDGSMQVEERVVVTGRERQLPKRAPAFSSEQIASSICTMSKFGRSTEPMLRAHKATVAAEEAERAFLTGDLSFEAYRDAEAARQDAVLAQGGPLLGVVIGILGKKGGLPPPEWRSVKLEGLDLFTFTEDGRTITAVSGVARNTSKEARDPPPVTFYAIDRNDFILAAQSSLLPFETLAPGESRSFEVRFHNPPANMREVRMAFAPPFRYRGRRDCDGFDPAATFAASLPPPKDDERPRNVLKLDVLAPQPDASAPADYTPAELYALMMYFRRESELAWRCINDPTQNIVQKTLCADGKSDVLAPLNWRDMFAMSELLDEAWGEARAIEDAQHAGADASRAEARRMTRVAEVRATGEAALRRAGEIAPDLQVSANAVYGLDLPAGLYVDVSGDVVNTDVGPRRLDALAIAAVDRFGLPLRSLRLEVGRQLKPGERYSFKRRLPIMGTLPREVSWQVRIGALSPAVSSAPIDGEAVTVPAAESH